MEIKLGLSFFGCIISHSECIFVPFVVFLWHLIERLDPEAVTHDVRLNKQIVYTGTLNVILEISVSDWVCPLNKLIVCENSALCMRYLYTCVFLSGSGCYLLVWRFFWFLAVGSGCSTNPHAVYLYFRYVIQFASPPKPRGSAATIKSARLLLVTEYAQCLEVDYVWMECALLYSGFWKMLMTVIVHTLIQSLVFVCHWWSTIVGVWTALCLNRKYNAEI